MYSQISLLIGPHFRHLPTRLVCFLDCTWTISHPDWSGSDIVTRLVYIQITLGIALNSHEWNLRSVCVCSDHSASWTLLQTFDNQNSLVFGVHFTHFHPHCSGSHIVNALLSPQLNLLIALKFLDLALAEGLCLEPEYYPFNTPPLDKPANIGEITYASRRVQEEQRWQSDRGSVFITYMWCKLLTPSWGHSNKWNTNWHISCLCPPSAIQNATFGLCWYNEWVSWLRFLIYRHTQG